MYSLGTFLAVLSSLLLLRNLRTRTVCRRRWFFYALTAAAFLYTHHYALFTVASQACAAICVVLFGREDGKPNHLRKLKGTLGAYFVVLLMYLPMLPVLRTQVGRVQEEYWIDSLSFNSMVQTMRQLFLPAYQFTSHGMGKAVGIVLIVSCIVLGTFVVWRRARAATLIWCVSFLPLLLRLRKEMSLRGGKRRRVASRVMC